MIVPNRHIATLAAATHDERCELMDFTRVAEEALTGRSIAPHGLNVGMNLGRSAGAGIVDHMHVHVVPRWNGDTNFMTVVGEVRVLPEDLAHRRPARLRPAFAKNASRATQMILELTTHEQLAFQRDIASICPAPRSRRRRPASTKPASSRARWSRPRPAPA